jgi:hypothetical protein
MPVNIDEHHLQMLANTFGCAVGKLTSAYLGLPLGTTKPTIQDLTPIVDQIERRLNASARFLDYGGRLQLVNSVHSTLPNHYLSFLEVHKTIIKVADRSRRHCLWSKEEGPSNIHSLAARPLVCKPKEKGGLGIIDFQVKNQALFLKLLHKFYTRRDIPWVKLVWSLYSNTVPAHAQSKHGSFWWQDIFSLIDIYRGITSSQIGHGDTVLFWKDHWNIDQLLCDRFPRLFSFALNEDISVADFIRSEDQFQFFALPLPVQVYEELSALLNITRELGNMPVRCTGKKLTFGQKCWHQPNFAPKCIATG